ncbi:MAG: hypothetical protein K2X71_29055 [Methylobacterium sp.]|uniref:hypothetical protein n=1 Tax=Methylobacterium sp. TaxID=409 RepID=UPI002583284A|nr:hypothetical protein [Methylobacterium sp.]MBY0300040.1 hypothetical protein [Methylobacterium sp.]
MTPLVKREDFHPLPPEPNGDKSKTPIFTAVGQALNSWEHVEGQIASLYGVLLGTSIPVGAIRAYGAIATFNARQSMVNAASAALFHYQKNDTLRDAIKYTLENVCKDASARRNEIAHGIVIKRARGSGSSGGYFLTAGLYSSLKRDMRFEAKYEYTSRQIKNYAHLFDKLTTSVSQLTDAVLDFQDSLRR